MSLTFHEVVHTSDSGVFFYKFLLYTKRRRLVEDNQLGLMRLLFASLKKEDSFEEQEHCQEQVIGQPRNNNRH